MEKAVSYIRVSTQEQKEEGYSLPAQKKLLREYAKKKGIEIVREFKEAETAKREGRSKFREMVFFLKQNPNVTSILVEKTDRLYRNFTDMVSVDELGRRIHFVKEGQIIGPDSRSHEKLMHDIKVVLAKNYIENLSEETKKGMLEKAEQGHYPSFAPLGYMNDREAGDIVIDFARAPIIRKLFEIYAENSVSLRELTQIAYAEGLRTRKSRRVQKSTVARIMQNAIYVGDFQWKGKRYKGGHDPIVSRELFDSVQAILRHKNRGRGKRRSFAFRGLLTCGTCGCAITAEIKKGKYVYYHCTGGRGACRERAVREEELARMLGEPLRRLRITEERLQWIQRALRESFRDEKTYRDTQVRRLQAEYAKLQSRMDSLYEDKLDGVVTENFWKRRSAEYTSRQAKVSEDLQRHAKANVDYMASGARILELAQKAYSLYLAQEPFEQRKILDLVLSNSTLKDGRVETKLREPFATLADGATQEARLRRRGVSFDAANKIWLPG